MESKPGHRRGRSLSEGLKLEESEKGVLVISGINNASSDSQGLKEGDEIVGATIHFDELSKDDVLKLLKLIEPFDEKVEVLTKNKLRPSLGTLNRCLKTPEEMLNDSYNKLYNAKIKRFMKNDTPAGAVEASLNGELKVNRARPQWSKPSLNRSPQVSMDTKTLQVEVPSSLQSPDLPVPFNESSGDQSHANLPGGNLNVSLPTLGLKVPEVEGGIEVSRLNMAASSPNLNATDHRLTGTFPEGPDIDIRPDVNTPNITTPLADLKIPGSEHPQRIINVPNVSLPKAGLEVPGRDSKGPEVNVLDIGLNPLEGYIPVRTLDINAPRFDIEGMNKKCEMPKFKIPDLGLSGPNISEPDCSAPRFDHTPELDLNAPDINMKTPSGKVRVQSVKKVKNHTLNVDDPSSYLPAKLPKVRLSGRVPEGQDLDIDTGFKTSDVDFRAPKMDASLPNPDLKGLKGDLKLPDTDIDDLKTSDLNLSAPKIDLPECSLPSSGKFKIPDFGFPGTLPKTQDLDLDADVKTTNISLKAPKIKGDVDIPDMSLPQVDPKTPKVDINTPEVDMNAPSGKLKMSNFKMPVNLKGPGIDVDGRSEKCKMPSFKMPDFGLSGPKATAPDIVLKMPDLDLSGHELKKELSPPDLSMPDIDLKGHNAPDIKIGMPSGKFNIPTLNNPDTNIHVPSIEADVPSGKFKMPKIFGTLSRRPDVGLTAADLSLKARSTKGGIDGPDLDLPNMDIKTPTLNMGIGSPKGKFKMPKLRMPNFDLSGLKGPNFNMDGDLDRQNVGVPKPVLDIDAPSLDLKGPKTDLKIPDVGSPSNFDLPSGKVKTPTLNLKEPKMDVNTPSLDVDAPTGKFKLPKFKMPTFSLSGLKGPDIDIDGDLEGPDVDINAPQTNVKGPKMDLKIPDVNMGSPSSKFKMPGLKMPDFGLSGPNIERPDFDLNLPDLDLSAPKLKGRISPPNLKLPKADLKAPKLDLNGPDMNINMPSGKLRVPTLKKPKAELGALDFNVDAPSGKLKMPTLDVSGTLPKGPSLDIKSGVNKKDWSLKGPKIKGGLDAPNMDLPNIDINPPKFDVNIPNVDVGSPKTKFKMPKFKIPTFGISGLKQTDIGGDLEAPDIDINTPQVNVKGPKMDLKMTDVDMGSPPSKFKMPGLKMPDFGLSGPNIERPDFDLNLPDLDLSAPKLKGRISPPNLKLPKANLKAPKLDLNGPDMNINMPSGKLRVPTLKKPKAELGALDFNVDAPSGKLKMPTLDVSGTLPKGPSLDIKSGVKKTDWSLKGPKIKGGLDAPNMDLPNIDIKPPKFDVNTPNVDVGSPKTKFKMPKFKMPTFGISGLKQPDIEGDLEAPDLDVNTPKVNVKGPKMDLEMPDVDMGSPSSKFKMPGLKMPDFGLSGPNIERPDFDLNPPDLDIAAPRLKGRISPPDFKLPKADLKAPKLDLNGPDMNLNMPSGKLRVPTLKKPKAELGALDFNVDAPSGKLKMPTLDVSGTLPKGPSLDIKSGVNKKDWSLKGPKIKGGLDAPNMDLPNIDINPPKFDVNTPNLDIGSPKTKLKMPKLKMPTFGISGPKGPDVDINGDLEGPDLNIPHSDISSPSGKFKMPSFKIPDFGLSGPKITGPDMHLSASEVKGGICLPDMDLPNVHLKDPKLDLKAPKPDMNSPDIGIDLPSGKFKTPTLKMPKFSLPGLNEQDAEWNAGIEGLGNEMPSGNIKGPQTDFDLPEKKFNLPSFKMPQFGSPDLKRTGSDIDFGAAMRSPDMIMFPPKATFDVKAPNLRGTVSATKLSPSNINTSLPKAAIESPKLHPKASELDIDAPSSKHRMPHCKHKYDISGPNMKIPVLDIDADVKCTHTDRKSRKVKGRSSYPIVDADLPKADLTGMDRRAPDLNIDDLSDKVHIPKHKKSNLDQSHAKILDINSDLSPKISVPKLPLPKNYEQGMVVSQPDVNLSSKTDLQSHTQHRNASAREIDQTKRAKSTKKSEFGISMPNLTYDSNFKSPEDPEGYYVTVFPKQLKTEVSGQTKVTDRKVANLKSLTLGRLDFSASNVDLEVPEENDLKGSTFWFSKLI